MPRDRVPPIDHRLYVIIRTKNSVVRRRLIEPGGIDIARFAQDELIETVSGSVASWHAMQFHRQAIREALGYGEGWFVTRDGRGAWCMRDARKHPIPQHVPPSHRGLLYNEAETLKQHERDAERRKRGPRGGKREGRKVKMHDTLFQLDFEVPERDVEKWLTRKGVVRA